MLNNDELTLIALELDFHTLPNFCCNKKLQKIIWNNPTFWGNKLEKEIGFKMKKTVCSHRNAYKFLCTNTPEKILEKASSFGWLEFVIHIIEKFPHLDLKSAMRTARQHQRKNVYNYFKRKGVHYSPDYAIEL